MLCPVCKIPAIIVEYDQIELDYCPNCCGVWFDAGELELLLDAAGPGGSGAFLDTVLGSKAVGAKEKKRRCPICNLKMKKSFVDGQNKMLVDICPDQHGIWFDGGEMERLLTSLAGERQGAGVPYQKLLEFFGETLKASTSGG
jgi:Zn-finger nucleic acid-binding protein